VFAGASIIEGVIFSSSDRETAYAEAAAASAVCPDADPLEAVHAVPTRAMPIAAAAIDQPMCRILPISFVRMGVSLPTHRRREWGRRSRCERDLGPWNRARAGRTLAGMFARYFVEIAGDRDVIEQVMLDAPGTWLPTLATSANHRGDRLLAEVGFGDDVRIARTVALAVGDPIRMPTKTTIPLRWSASGPTGGVFPALDADLEVAPLEDGRCQLAISARYEPPLGAVGRAIDRALLARVAEATIKDFLDRVRDSIARRVSDAAPLAQG
jgi:hypothetical protein